MLRIYGGTIIQTIARMNLQLATAQHSWKVKLESVFAGVPLRGQDRLHDRQTDRQRPRMKAWWVKCLSCTQEDLSSIQEATVKINIMVRVTHL